MTLVKVDREPTYTEQPKEKLIYFTFKKRVVLSEKQLCEIVRRQMEEPQPVVYVQPTANNNEIHPCPIIVGVSVFLIGAVIAIILIIKT